MNLKNKINELFFRTRESLFIPQLFLYVAYSVWLLALSEKNKLEKPTIFSCKLSCLHISIPFVSFGNSG